MENLNGQTESQFQSEPEPPSESQMSSLHHKHPTQVQRQDLVQQVYTTIEPHQIIQQPMGAFELENISAEPLEVLEAPQEDRLPTIDESVILKQNPRWKCIGFPVNGKTV